MNRVVFLPATATQPKRFLIEELRDGAWWLQLDVAGRVLEYTCEKHAIFMAAAFDGVRFPQDISRVTYNGRAIIPFYKGV